MARAVLCLAVLAAALASGGAAPAATPGVNGHLLIASGQRHEMTLIAMEPREHGDRLMLNYGADQGATYSPDGTRIAFMNNYDGDYEICVMNADGTGVEQLTKNSALDAYPSWSPDGSKIAFTSNRDGDFDIYTMNANGSHQTNITSDDPSYDDFPRWSPDGRFIAIETDRNSNGNLSVALLSPDGQPQATVGSVMYTTYFDSWSPDGKSILVDSNSSGDFDIYRYDLDAGGPLQWSLMQPKIVSNDSASEGSAIWSPDGKQIAFASNRDGDFEIYLMNAEGGPQRQLTHNNVDDIVMDWQSLHDTRDPSVKALPSRGTPGKRIALRFKASDNSGRVSIAITVFVGKRPYGYLRTGLKWRTAGKTYTARWSSPKVNGTLRFCAEAYDPSGNESARSCAPIVTR
jgi:dipeptidyl aminopeptidase/acylaminoacyl peptidase